MSDLLHRVEDALDESPDVVAVYGPDLRLLAEREPLLNGGAHLVFLLDGSEELSWRP